MPPDPSIQPLNLSEKQISPFAPIDRQVGPSAAGQTPLITSSSANTQPSKSDDEESDVSDLKEADLKLQLKQQKRHGKHTGQLLDQLHENYHQLLQKYAQAENTIDQLRFQPKIMGENTPTASQATQVFSRRIVFKCFNEVFFFLQGTIHFVQQTAMNIGTVRSSGIYPSTTVTPMSSIMPRPSTTTNSSSTMQAKSQLTSII